MKLGFQQIFNTMKLGLKRIFNTRKKTLDEFYDNADPLEVYPESKEYLEKYWLNEEEYVSHWQPLQARIFDSKVDFVQEGRIFLPEFKLMTLSGGCTFGKKDFLRLQACMRALGEEYFVVIENTALSYGDYKAYKKEKDKISGKPLKFKYPVAIKWEELDTGDRLTDLMLCVVEDREFYVFGESGLWGKYAANAYSVSKKFPSVLSNLGFGKTSAPLDILGFKNECAALFQEKFHMCMTEDEREELRAVLSSPFLHPAYKECAHELEQLSSGKWQAYIKGTYAEGEAVFKNLIQGARKTKGGEAYQLKSGAILASHTSAATHLFAININHAGKKYKNIFDPEFDPK
jgi:hypothetical protein